MKAYSLNSHAVRVLLLTVYNETNADGKAGVNIIIWLIELSHALLYFLAVDIFLFFDLELV
jgi:hypothetical protein